MKGWDDVSVKKVKNGYHLLLNVVEKIVRRLLDIKKIESIREASSGGKLT